MNPYSLSHLSDQAVLCELATMVAHENTATATLLAHIAEVDYRQLFLPAGFDSMFAYCVHVLHLSDDSALKRIHAARAARRFPAIFAALAGGRLHLSGVAAMARHLTPENAQELLAAAADKTRAEILLLLSERFPQPDVPARLEPLSPAPARHARAELAPGRVDASASEHAPGSVAESQLAPGRVEPPRARVAPLSPGRFALQVTIAQATHDKLQYARTLLGHAVPSGDVAEVLDRALDALIAQLEKQKFAAASRPRPQRSSADPRHIPAHVKRAVLERDGGQCTFVSEAGQRCPARTRLEFDHIDPVARGGKATVDGVRIRCRAHNQYEAECMFGEGFMATKREAARQAAEARKRTAEIERDPDRSVVPWLRGLGFRLEEARAAAEACEHMGDAPMEERIRAALRSLPQRTVPPGRAA